MRRTAILLLLLSAALAFADTEQVYSDVAYIEESGDQVGVEIRLTIAADGTVTGTLLDYQGLDAEPVALTGRKTGEAVTLSGSTSEARVTVDARIARKRLVGKLRYHLSEQTNEFNLDLPRVSRPREAKE